jgi:hypothetical protein
VKRVVAMKKLFSFLLFTILPSVFLIAFLPFASAVFQVDYTPTKDTIYQNESAKFFVTLTNFENYDDRFIIYTLDPHWTLDPSSIGVLANKDKPFTLSISPTEGTNAGAYQVPITFRSTYGDKQGTTLSKNFFLFLKNPYPAKIEYVPDVGMDVSFPENIDPRNKLPIEVKMKNRNTLSLKNLSLTVQSALFMQTVNVDLSSFEEKTVEIWVDLDALQQPAQYKMHITLMRDNSETVANAVKNFAILGYSTLQTKTEKNEEFLKTTESITITNDGNYEKAQTVRLQLPWFKRLFTSTTPDYVLKKENSITSLTWNVSLTPEESTSIVLVTNYRGLALTILVIVLIIVGYFVFRSPVISLKRSRMYDSGFEKASHLKVKLFVKNRTSKPVFNIKIIDSLPHIAEFVEEDTLGTLKPVKIIRQDKFGTIMRWEVEKLDPYEERIITYKANFILNVVGNIHLPAFKTKFEAKLGSERTVGSNSVELQNEKHQPIPNAK